jgi:hypothetical protein
MMQQKLMKNNDVLSWICTQAEIVLLYFANGLDDSGFIITNLTQFEVVFENTQNKQVLKFIFANEYTYGLGVQPLQNIILESPEGRKMLSEVVDRQEGKGAFRRYLAASAPSVSQMEVFRILLYQYLMKDSTGKNTRCL